MMPRASVSHHRTSPATAKSGWLARREYHLHQPLSTESGSSHSSLQAAKNQATLNYANTVFDAKVLWIHTQQRLSRIRVTRVHEGWCALQRLIGRRFNDDTVQLDKKMWPFQASMPLLQHTQS